MDRLTHRCTSVLCKPWISGENNLLFFFVTHAQIINIDFKK